MFNKKNSIKEILRNTKNLLIQDNELSKEKENFDSKLSKALEGNILVLNKLSNNDNIDEIDKRSKKITQIVEYQSNDSLLLNKEIKDKSEILVLSNEIKENNQALLLNNEILDDDKKAHIQNIENSEEISDLAEIQKDTYTKNFNSDSSIDQINNELELNNQNNVTEGKSYLSILERIEQLENKKEAIIKKLDQTIEESRLRDPSEEISLKFDILSNQISNDVDSKIDKLNDEINLINDEKDGIYQELNSQKELVESGFAGIELSSENLKNQIDNIETKIEDSQKFQEENIENKLKVLENKIEENIENKLNLLDVKINEKLEELQRILEEDREKKKIEEEEKNKDPNYQANLRLNSIYKILEAQISHSLINNNLSINKESAQNILNEVSQPQNINTKISTIKETDTLKETNQMLESILHSTRLLSEDIKNLKNQNINQFKATDGTKIELINNQLQSLVQQQHKLDKMHTEVNSLSNQKYKLEEIGNQLKSLPEDKSNLNSILSDQKSKLEEIGNQLKSLPEDKSNLNSILSDQKSKLEEVFSFLKSIQSESSKTQKLDDLIQYFKNSEIQKLEHIQFDFRGIRQFEDLNSSKKFLEELILSETQNWIKSNQKTIEDISKKLLYK